MHTVLPGRNCDVCDVCDVLSEPFGALSNAPSSLGAERERAHRQSQGITMQEPTGQEKEAVSSACLRVVGYPNLSARPCDGTWAVPHFARLRTWLQLTLSGCAHTTYGAYRLYGCKTCRETRTPNPTTRRSCRGARLGLWRWMALESARHAGRLGPHLVTGYWVTGSHSAALMASAISHSDVKTQGRHCGWPIADWGLSPMCNSERCCLVRPRRFQGHQRGHGSATEDAFVQ